MFLYFTKVSAAIDTLMVTVFILEEHLQPGMIMYNVYDRYFYLRHIVISKEHFAAIYLNSTVIISGGDLQ